MTRRGTAETLTLAETDLAHFHIFGLLHLALPPGPPDAVDWAPVAQRLLRAPQVCAVPLEETATERGRWQRGADRSGRALYLVRHTPPQASGGTLRILPGTHRHGTAWETEGRLLADPSEHFGLAADLVPAAEPLARTGAVLFDAHCWYSFIGKGPGPAPEVVRYEVQDAPDRRKEAA